MSSAEAEVKKEAVEALSDVSSQDNENSVENVAEPTVNNEVCQVVGTAGGERSSIKVYFTDWVPQNNETPEEPVFDQSFKPTIGGDRPRYFQMSTKYAHKRFKPGLGLNVDEVLAKQKNNKLKKRKKSLAELDAFTLAKRIKITPEKPACAVLHELNPNLEYTYQESKSEGFQSSPTFTCIVMYPPIGGTEYTGEGRSKKSAKNDVAERILASLGILSLSQVTKPSASEELLATTPTEHPVNSVWPREAAPDEGYSTRMEIDQCEIDFTSDDMVNTTSTFSAPVPGTVHPLSQPMMVDTAVLKRLRNIPNFEENICLALNTIVMPSSIEYETLGEEGPPHDKKFTIKVHVNTQSFIGEGGSKKKAKADGAKKAVIHLLGEEKYFALVNSSMQQMPLSNLQLGNTPSEITAQSEGKSKRKKRKNKTKSSASLVIPLNEDEDEEMEDEDDGDDDSWGEYDLNFADFISNSVREKYEQLLENDSSYATYKVLAGVVLTTGSPMIFNSEVIAVTTGTKCIEGDCMSEQGLSVNDCHAEILATRCVRDFLYSQIELFESECSDQEKLGCILEANSDSASSFKYQLKCDVKFHLFISTSPCGDARIFSPRGIELLEEDQPTPPSDLEDIHPNKLNRGVLRSKVEAGEGTIPCSNLYQGPQTWDSIVSGNALYTMSCSDKVCRWNILGLQGALLHNFIGTVFYSSIVLGSLHHPVHFKRAVYGRVEMLNSRLEIPFHVHKPRLMMVSREEKRKVKKSPGYALCWSAKWSTPEILAASKGRCEPGGVASRLTKRILFTRFLKLYKNLTGKRENYADLTYHEAKQEASGYQKAKAEFTKFFAEQNLGPWIGKPVEQDSFKIK